MKKIVGLSVACSMATFSFSVNGLNVMKQFVSDMDESRSAMEVQEVEMEGSLKRTASGDEVAFMPARKKPTSKPELVLSDSENFFSDEEETTSDLVLEGKFDFVGKNPVFSEEEERAVESEKVVEANAGLMEQLKKLEEENSLLAEKLKAAEACAVEPGKAVEPKDDRSASKPEDVEANAGLMEQLKKLEEENSLLAEKLKAAEACAVDIEKARGLITKKLEFDSTKEDFKCPDVTDVDSLMQWIVYSRESYAKIGANVRNMVHDTIWVFYNYGFVSQNISESQFKLVQSKINSWGMGKVFGEFNQWLADVHQVLLKQNNLDPSISIGSDAAVSIRVKEGTSLDKKSQEASSKGKGDGKK